MGLLRMGFWVFMIIMDTIMPLTMIVFGKYFMHRTPREINRVYGYRTAMSMKNITTWDFAHKHFGKIWYYLGTIILSLSVIAMLFCISKDYGTIETVGGIICGVQLALVFISIVPTEIALRKTFDKNGNRRV